MYRILGSDQQEYGPVSADDVRRWIVEGRANASTMLRAEGSTEWRPLGEWSEFADVLTSPTASAPPPSPHPLPASAPPPARTNGLALASLILGILGVVTCGLTALAGLILGIVALKKTSASRDGAGRGLAIAGTIVSAVFLLLLPALAGMLLPALAKAKQKATNVVCMNNTKQLCLGLMMYTADNEDTFPRSDKWCDAIQQYLGGEGVFKCPLGDPAARSHYGFNRRLGGIAQQKVSAPATTVMVFEIAGGWNASGGAELLVSKPRHPGVVVGYADGHCEVVMPGRLSSLRWDP